MARKTTHTGLRKGGPAYKVSNPKRSTRVARTYKASKPMFGSKVNLTTGYMFDAAGNPHAVAAPAYQTYRSGPSRSLTTYRSK